MIKRGKNNRGNILTENIVFIVLNLVFLSILVLFLFSRASDVSHSEEMYAKQIALIIDSASPGMNITLDMSDAVQKAKKKNWDGKIVSIDGNIVTVKLQDKGSGYSYDFFNDVDLSKQYFYGNKGNDFKFRVEGYKNG